MWVIPGQINECFAMTSSICFKFGLIVLSNSQNLLVFVTVDGCHKIIKFKEKKMYTFFKDLTHLA